MTRRPDAPTGARRDRLFSVVEAAFAQRRKTLRNNLRALADHDRLAAAAQVAGVDLGARAETVATSSLAALADALAPQAPDAAAP